MGSSDGVSRSNLSISSYVCSLVLEGFFRLGFTQTWDSMA